jgi:hypothetical protein
MKPGDIVFAHSTGILGRIIRLGEWIRFCPGSMWNHVAILDREVDGVWYIIQAEAKGVTNDKALDSVAPGGHYTVLSTPRGVDNRKVLRFARAQVGYAYGWLTILAVAVDILTPFWFPAFRSKNSWICSALGAEALRAGGWIKNWRDIYLVTPAQLWTALYPADEITTR